MEYLRPFTFNEKFAAGLLVLFCPIYLAAAVSLEPSDNLGKLAAWQVAWAVITLVAFATAAATVFLKPEHHPSRVRMVLGRILPLFAMGVAILLSSFAMDALLSNRMQAFANSHQHELAGKAPQAVIYLEGIPDGGVAIVRSPGRNPEGFSQAVMIDLTGERIKSCKPLNDTDWACHFD